MRLSFISSIVGEGYAHGNSGYGGPRITKVYGDPNYCHRLGSTIFTFRRRPLSPVVLSASPPYSLSIFSGVADHLQAYTIVKRNDDSCANSILSSMSLAQYRGHRNMQSAARYTPLAPDRFCEVLARLELGRPRSEYSQFALSSLPIRSQPSGRGQRTIVQFFKEFETCSAYTKLHSVTTLVRAVALANYYPTLARAVSRLATNDAQARQELYEHARTVLAKHLRKQDPQMSAPETIGERIAFEAAILRLEAEWQSALKRNAKPDIVLNSISPRTSGQRQTIC